MRRAYIGLSGPLAYDYKNQFDRPDNRDGSAPNALLEDSLGLIILYDEIIFLSPQLCPHNMRELPYVKYLNSWSDFEKKFQVAVARGGSLYAKHDKRDINFANPFEPYEPALCQMTGQPFRVNRDEARFIPDNHTHGFFVSSAAQVTASSTWFQNVLIDWITRDVFKLLDCDVISNSATSVYYNALDRDKGVSRPATGLAHRLIARRLPSYLHELGPYHPCLEELRNHPYLEDTRKHLTQMVEGALDKDLDELADKVTSVAYEIRNGVFRRHLAHANEYWVIGKATATELAGLLVPGVGLVSELLSERAEEKERSRMRWAGFVCDLDSFSGQMRP